MRAIVILVLVLVLVWASSAQADFLITPRFTPEPAHPDRQRLTWRMGTANASFTIRFDGSVTDVTVLSSSHADYARAVKRALDQWRYEPWALVDGNPATVRVVLPFMFMPAGSTQRTSEQTTLVRKRCQDLSEEHDAFIGAGSARSVVEMPTFDAALKWMNRALVDGQISSDEHKVLSAQMVTALPKILQECLDNPDSKLTEFLPRQAIPL